MNHKKIIKTYLDFFVKRKHKLLDNVSLIPEEDDPSSLFISAGMQPLKKYILGLAKPPSKKLCSNQRCFRTGDIDKVGNGSHLTFFFMLGNWGIGDYWKGESIKIGWEMLTKAFKFDPKKLWITVYKGDKTVKKDTEAEKAWFKVGVPKNRIIKLGKDNFWAAGPTGPCGSCTEIFFDTGKKCRKKNCKPGCDCDRWVEIWNHVFIEYNKDKKLEKLKINTVDTGAGVERFAMVLQGVDSVFETDLFEPVLRRLENVSKRRYGSSKEVDKAMRIILDHARASVFLIGDGVVPEKIERGYVLRRIIRRMIRYGNKLGLAKEQVLYLCGMFIDMYKDEYSTLKNKNTILKVIEDEYTKFLKSLNRGTKLLEQVMGNLKKKIIPGKDVFKLYDTYGFPIELTEEMAKEKGFKIDKKGYEKAFSDHRKVSAASAKTRFKGGLGEGTAEAAKLHTATHLLLAGLNKVLGGGIEQRGSNITSLRLRFDFNFDRKLTDEEVKKVEDFVNDVIDKGVDVEREELSLKEAKKRGFGGIFESKYGDKVSCYFIGTISKEICGGPHAKNTKELGRFKIVKQQSVSVGVRRIKAVLE